MTDEPKREVNGLRTAVRYGAMTKEQALDKYNKAVATSGLRSPSFENWIARR